jgi:hypothetical protein
VLDHPTPRVAGLPRQLIELLDEVVDKLDRHHEAELAHQTAMMAGLQRYIDILERRRQGAEPPDRPQAWRSAARIGARSNVMVAVGLGCAHALGFRTPVQSDPVSCRSGWLRPPLLLCLQMCIDDVIAWLAGAIGVAMAIWLMLRVGWASAFAQLWA